LKLKELITEGFKQKNGMFLGYRVVNLTDDGRIQSQADKRVHLPLKLNAVHHVPNGGYWVTNDPQYALDYYSNGSWEEDEPRQALLTYGFTKDNVQSGDMDDIEPELSINGAVLLNAKELPL
jgi:hypothetical protein